MASATLTSICPGRFATLPPKLHGTPRRESTALPDRKICPLPAACHRFAQFLKDYLVETDFPLCRLPPEGDVHFERHAANGISHQRCLLICGLPVHACMARRICRHVLRPKETRPGETRTGESGYGNVAGSVLSAPVSACMALRATKTLKSLRAFESACMALRATKMLKSLRAFEFCHNRARSCSSHDCFSRPLRWQGYRP
jgi:hypothetical protein